MTAVPLPAARAAEPSSARAPEPSFARAVRGTAVRAAFAAAAAVALGAVHLHRPPTLCVLRATTGIPCPLCGSTTAAVRLGRGDVAGALLANPVALVAGALLVVAPLLARRVHVPHRARPWLFTGTAAFAWAWQLVRFDRIPFS